MPARAALAAGCLALACATATSFSVTSELREAQDSFSAAAAAENAARTRGLRGTDTGAAGAALGSAASGYALAARIAGDLRRQHEPELRSDGVYCSAVTIEAMSLWRMGERRDARTLAENATECTAEDAPPRDRTLLRALPGLVQADDAERLARDPDESYAAVEGNVDGALEKLGRVAAEVTPRQPVYVYLLTSQLAVLDTWKRAILAKGLPPDQRTAELTAFQGKRDTLLGRYAELLCPRDEDAIVDYWSALLGGTQTCE